MITTESVIVFKIIKNVNNGNFTYNHINFLTFKNYQPVLLLLGITTSFHLKILVNLLDNQSMTDFDRLIKFNVAWSALLRIKLPFNFEN